jgi:hypothetical protein
MQWQWVHLDYDHAPDGPDRRSGHGPTPEDCMKQIDEMEED